MAEIHRIRLAGPWQLERDGNPPAARKIKMPADWDQTLGADFLGPIRLRRSFGLPTGLDSGDRVMLVIEHTAGPATVSMNGDQLGPIHGDTAATFDVTRWLAVRNELVVEVRRQPVEGAAQLPAPGDPGGAILGEVRLEIHAV